jgi:hypothetical protein
MYTPETINEVNAENYQYSCWEREQKNKILALSNPSKKQVLWNQLFPKMAHDDNWMLEAKVF